MLGLVHSVLKASCVRVPFHFLAFFALTLHISVVLDSAILAKRKAELLQVCRVARCSIDRWSKRVVCFCACARLMHLRSGTRRRSCLNRRPSRLLLLAPLHRQGAIKRVNIRM